MLKILCDMKLEKFCSAKFKEKGYMIAQGRLSNVAKSGFLM